MKTMVINGEAFEVIRSQKTQEFVKYHLAHFEDRCLFAYYDNPSTFKLRIYYDWLDWYLTADCVRKFEVTSANCQTFVIGALYVDPDTLEILGYIRITACHNRLYLIK